MYRHNSRIAVYWVSAVAVTTIVLAGPLVSLAPADFLLTGSDHLDVTSSHTTGILYNSSSVDILSGYIDSLDAWNSSTVDIIGGTVSRLNAWNSSTVDITGGQVNGGLILRDTSSVAISGGTINGYLSALGTSSVTITGGNFRDDHATYLVASYSSTVNISGGFVNVLLPNDTSRVTIFGGRVKQVTALGTSSITFCGYDFTCTEGMRLDGDKVLGTGELNGKWFDGTPWTTNVNVHDTGATILAIPEPATLWLLALGGLALLRRRRPLPA